MTDISQKLRSIEERLDDAILIMQEQRHERLWSLKDIANFMGCSVNKAKVLVQSVNFPRAFNLNHDGRNKVLRWQAKQVRDYVRNNLEPPNWRR